MEVIIKKISFLQHIKRQEPERLEIEIENLEKLKIEKNKKTRESTNKKKLDGQKKKKNRKCTRDSN